MNLKVKPRIVEIKKGENIVILTEDEYEQMIDALDIMEAERVIADENDPVLSLKEAEKRLFKRLKKGNK